MFGIFGGKSSLVAKDMALKGRASPMKISPTHFVLNTPMQPPWPQNMKVAVFANGCFWGSEKGAWRLPFGIHSTAVGYAAGYTPNPTYEEVCSGQTVDQLKPLLALLVPCDHTPHSVYSLSRLMCSQVVYDPSKISFVDIMRWFWESHDPSQGMGQGNDRGTQYRSGFYYFDDEQKRPGPDVFSTRCRHHCVAVSLVHLLTPTYRSCSRGAKRRMRRPLARRSPPRSRRPPTTTKFSTTPKTMSSLNALWFAVAYSDVVAISKSSLFPQTDAHSATPSNFSVPLRVVQPPAVPGQAGCKAILLRAATEHPSPGL
eukprot:6197091-Pleurochrysis_carterae.AAC.7